MLIGRLNLFCTMKVSGLEKEEAEGGPMALKIFNPKFRPPAASLITRDGFGHTLGKRHRERKKGSKKDIRLTT